MVTTTQASNEGLVLIVDDTPANLSVLDHILTSEGLAVLSVDDGAAALAVAASDQPDLILLDVVMPGMDGFEVCRRLKADVTTRDIPVVFMTTLSDVEDQVRGFEAGAVDYVTKPFHERELLARIRTQLALRAMTRALQEHNVQLKREISERIHAEAARERTLAELRVARDLAQSASEAKSSFLASMSHELRTPLNAILGFTQLFIARAGWPAEDLEHLQIIRASGMHLLGLINSVLEMSKIEAGKLALSPSSVDVPAFVRSLLGMFLPQARSKGLQLEVDLAADLLHPVEVDEGKLRQVLINLLGNAIKFSDAGHVILRVGTQPGEQTDEIGLSFAVEDTGQGIAAEERHLIFEAFGQAEAGRRNHEGTGLGLAIARELARLLGGELGFSSTVGVGTTFSFAIPARRGHDVVTRDDTVPRAVHDPALAAYRILIVEDKPANRQVLRELLTPYGFAVREAENGREGVALWETWRPQLILMDMRMPVMDGYAATREIRARDVAHLTTIVALTASAFDEQRAQIQACGCEAVVLKPFRHREILDVLERFLGLDLHARSSAVHERAAPAHPDQLGGPFQKLPAPLRRRLHDAALRADEAALRVLLAELRSTTSESTILAAELLCRALEAGRFEEISTWTEVD